MVSIDVLLAGWDKTYIDHDDFLAFGVPGLAPDDAFRTCGRIGKVKIALFENGY